MAVLVFCAKLVWKLLCNLCWSQIHSSNPASASQVQNDRPVQPWQLDRVGPEPKTGNAEGNEEQGMAARFPS